MKAIRLWDEENEKFDVLCKIFIRAWRQIMKLPSSIPRRAKEIFLAFASLDFHFFIIINLRTSTNSIFLVARGRHLKWLLLFHRQTMALSLNSCIKWILFSWVEDFSHGKLASICNLRQPLKSAAWKRGKKSLPFNASHNKFIAFSSNCRVERYNLL